jgi:5-hydroxyisourate hydrolase
MGKLSTHVLDTARGVPARGVLIELFVGDGEHWQPLVTAVTDSDGRTRAPLLQGEAVRTGRYRLVFAAGDYFRRTGATLPEPAFVDRVTIDFGIAEAGGDYHVPLLVSPWAWSTYRGS